MTSQEKLQPFLFTPNSGLELPPAQLCPWQLVRDQYTLDSRLSLVRGRNAALRLAWGQTDRNHRGRRTYTLWLSADPDLKGARVFEGLRQTILELEDLHLGNTYYWAVEAFENGRSLGRTPVWHFHTHPQPPRWLNLYGLSNLRDAGGWKTADGGRVRQGMLYRGGELNNHHALSRAAARFLTDTLGIRTDLDLRNHDERPGPALDEKRVKYVLFPVDAYSGMLSDWSSAGYRGLFERADRTGTLVFLINACLGVSRADLIHDYELTTLSGLGIRLAEAEYFQRFLSLLDECTTLGDSLPMKARCLIQRTGVKPEHLDTVLGFLREPASAA